tara:strand:+ start:1891 stop:2073 length:183 start_codon:yes stop_codon:yes gene_type:complete
MQVLGVASEVEEGICNVAGYLWLIRNQEESSITQAILQQTLQPQENKDGNGTKKKKGKVD